jgi:RNA polymerase sigma-70 factor (ECF subfamily)
VAAGDGFAEPHPQDEELALLDRVGHGDEAALATLYSAHAPGVFAMARRILKSGERAEDVVQEIFVKLWDNPQQYDATRGSLRAYLLLQARTRSLDMLRAEDARRRRERKDAGAERHVENPELAVIDEAEVGQVRRAIEFLNPAEREAIELAFFGGLTYREVADVLDEPEGTVKSRIRLGLQRMRRAMASGAC